MKINKVVRISLSGGIIGLLTTDPRRTLDNRINKENLEGWSAIYFLPHKDTNLFVELVRILVLVCTCFMWTWGAGYLVLFERDTKMARAEASDGRSEEDPQALPKDLVRE